MSVIFEFGNKNWIRFWLSNLILCYVWTTLMQVVDKLSINYTFIFPVSKHLIIRYRVSPSELRLLSKSALRGRSIDNFIELWCLVASRGLEIWVLQLKRRLFSVLTSKLLFERRCLSFRLSVFLQKNLLNGCTYQTMLV